MLVNLYKISLLSFCKDYIEGVYHLAGYLEMVIPLLLGLFLLGLKPGKLIFLIYLCCLLLTALVLSLSRGGWIGAGVSLVFMSVALLSLRINSKA